MRSPRPGNPAGLSRHGAGDAGCTEPPCLPGGSEGSQRPGALEIPGNAAGVGNAVGSLGMPAMTRPTSERWRLAAIPAALLLSLTCLASCGTPSRPVDVSAHNFGDDARGTVVFWARSDTITAARKLPAAVFSFLRTHSVRLRGDAEAFIVLPEILP